MNRDGILYNSRQNDARLAGVHTVKSFTAWKWIFTCHKGKKPFGKKENCLFDLHDRKRLSYNFLIRPSLN